MLIAHRGESHLAPENTLAAIKLAWANGAVAVELDVRMTRDGALIVCHDPDTSRTSGQNLIIREHDLARLLQLDVGRWKGAQWAGEHPPTLQQALATIPPQGRMFIEIKDGPETVPALVRVAKECGMARCTIISFDQNVIAVFKQAMPHIQACWLTNRQLDEQTQQWTPDVAQLIATARTLHADGLDLEATQGVDRELVTALHDVGLQVYVWTVDDPAQANKLLAAGVDGITTNRPAWLAEQLRLQD